MSLIFLAAPVSDLNAESMRRELEALGHSIWQVPAGLTPHLATYARAVDNGVLAGAAVVVVWDTAAEADEWVERALRVAQRLRKPIFVLVSDDTPLPPNSGLITVATGEDITLSPAGLTPESPLEALDAQLAHDLIRERRRGIEQARDWLTDPAYAATRERLLARLDFIAQYELLQNLRDLARAVLVAEAQKNMPPAQPNEAHHMFGVRCANGHVTYFDRRVVCSDHTQFPRSTVRRAEANLSELVLPCGTCGKPVKVRVDCEGYA